MSTTRRSVVPALVFAAILLPASDMLAGGTPTFVQQHYRWRNDNGSEVAATWKAAADTAITGMTRGENIRLRFCVANTNTSYSGSISARVEFAESTLGPWTAVSGQTNGLSAFEMTPTTGYADGDATTALLTGSGTFVAGKCVEYPSNTGASMTVDTNRYSNFEYCFRATAKAKGSTTYYFRVTNNGSQLSAYSKYATLTMAAGEANEAPVIVSPLTAQASTQGPFSYTILATGSEPITYGASGLPSGLTFGQTNMITGQATTPGVYPVGLLASNAWGAETPTLTLTVLANVPPVASNQTASVVEGGEVQIELQWSDPDNPQLTEHTFEIVDCPAQGTLQSYFHRYANTNYPNRYYYLTGSGSGTDNFTWKCRDLEDDSNVATCTVSIMANTPPTADSSIVTVNNGTRTGCLLSVTDPDTGQMRTFTLVQAPEFGRVEMPAPTTGNGNAYYTPDGGAFTGSDSLRWKVNDGADDSNVATVSITVQETAGVPAPQNQSEGVLSDITTDIPALYSAGGGYTSAVVKVSSPAHGTMVVSNKMFRYTPTAGYTGSDSFTWRMTYGVASLTGSTATATCTLLVCDSMAPEARPQNIVCIKDTSISVQAVFIDPEPGPQSIVSVIQGPSHGALTVSTPSGVPTFSYTPNPGWTGTDSFTWKINDGLTDSNVATNRVLVRAENSRGCMAVLVVVKDTVLPEISSEVARLQADLANEGYAVKVHSFTNSTAQQLWDYLKSEYEAPTQFVAGAILLGSLPTATGLMSEQTTDYAFMNMLKFRDNGYNKQHIWVSRIYTAPFAGGEVLRLKWALDANHGYRTGTHRLPYNAYWYDAAYGAVNAGNAVNTLIVWPTIEQLSPQNAYRKGGEFENSEIHSDGAFSGWDWHSSQLRYSIHSSCGPGRLGGPVNRNVCTYGGGNILGVGSSATAYSGQNVVMDDIACFNALAAGDTFGNGMTRPNLNPYRDFSRDMFYGDLSLPAKVAPSNAVPVIGAFTVNKTAGFAPLTVDFSVSASDPDGVIDRYEWFVYRWFNDGADGPEYFGPATCVSHTYTNAHRYVAEVQAVDNWKARAWSSMEVRVAPAPGEPVRVNCGRNLTYYTPGADYTDVAGNLWLHDQVFVSGTWGFSGDTKEYCRSYAVSGTEDDLLYQYFFEGYSGTAFTYKFPLQNGKYTVNLGFADMHSTNVGQRVMDVSIQGWPRVEGLDIYALAGPKTVHIVPFNALVENGEMTITVARNPASPDKQFLNTIEIIPDTFGPNQAPYAVSQTLTAESGRGVSVTLQAFDPERDSLTYSHSQPAHGTLSGTAPDLTYTPAADYQGEDSFTFKANDGALDSNPATVTITVHGVPAVALTSPADGAVFTVPATITLMADAGIPAGTITNVEFFRGTTKLGAVTNAPYSFGWSNVTMAGVYTLWARATSDAGVKTDSASRQITVAAQNSYVWKAGATGGWLVATNWTPVGFANTNVSACLVADGTAQTTTTTFQPTLTVSGVNGTGGTLWLPSNATLGGNGQFLAGGKVRKTGTASCTLSAVMELVDGTTSVIDVEDTGALTHSGTLRGAGTLRIGGVGMLSQTAACTEFNGQIELTGGHLRLTSGTRAYGGAGRILVNAGGLLSLANNSASWRIPGGMTLNGGTYREEGNNGTTWSADTPWTVAGDSTIETSDIGGFVDILGPLHGSGNLTIRRAAGSAERAVTLRGTGSTFSGTITVTASPTNAFLYLGSSEALASSGNLAAVAVEQATDEMRGVVVIGARKSGSTVTDVPGVNAKVRSLTLGGVPIEAGLYSQADPLPMDGFVVFNNVTSSLEIKGSGATDDNDRDGIPDSIDPDDDNDGMTDVDEAVAGTDPLNSGSMFSVQCSVFSGEWFRVEFDSISGRIYGVYCRDDLLDGQWLPLETNLAGTGNPMQYTDPAAGQRRFYRLKVRLP